MLSASELKEKCIPEGIALQEKKRVERSDRIEQMYAIVIKHIIAKLGNQIKEFPDQPDKWYVEEILDKDTLLNRINEKTVEYYLANKLGDNDATKSILKYIQFLRKKIIYVKFDELKLRLYRLGYILSEERYPKKFCGITYGESVFYYVSMKDPE